MTLVMSYVILVAAAIGACGVLLEAVLERKQAPRRWIWISSLGLALAATALAMVWPVSVTDPGATLLLDSSTLMLSEPTAESLPVPSRTASVDVLGAADKMLPFAWLISSAALLLAIAFGQRRLRRERRCAQPTQLAGQPALVSETIGPAVAGLRAPVVFVPSWVLALDEPSQHLLMAHEMEHVKTRDTAMLFAGALGAALMPWNPVVWWMVRRLRLSVEQDCDARVLAANPGVRRYADLLLLAATHPGLATRLLAAHFGEHSSDLVRRIDTMTRQGVLTWRRVVPSTVIASLLVVAACQADRPAPVAPLELRSEAATNSEPAYTEVEKKLDEKFSVVVFSSDGKQMARYAGEIPVAHLPEAGVQDVRVDEYRCGDSDCYSVRITLKPGHALNLDEIEVRKLPYKREGIGKKLEEIRVPEVLLTKGETETIVSNAKLRMDSSLAGSQLSGEAREVRKAFTRDSAGILPASNETIPNESGRYQVSAGPAATRRGGALVLYHLRDPGFIGPSANNVIVYRSDGSEIERFPTASRPMGSIQLFGVESIKDQKTGDCAPLSCPLTRITLKPGFTLLDYRVWKGRGK